MRKFSTPLVLLFALSSSVQSQNTFKKNAAYVEILGNGLILSANYELQLMSKPGLGVHAGIGLGSEKPVIPTGIVYLLDIGRQKSLIETGLNITFAAKSVLIEKPAIAISDPYQIVFSPSIGYRRHTTYGMMWKFIYSPFFSKDRTEWQYAGVSIGWRF